MSQVVAKREPESVQPVADVVSMFERLALDPAADVEKIERLMQLWERTEAKRAEQAFNAAMAEAQREMRSIGPDAYNTQTKSRYATYAALDRVLRPIYTAHGFGLSFDTGEGALELHVRMLCYVSHQAGYSRTYHIDMPADGKGAKGGDVMTRTHAVGSASQYGMRYLLKMIFNVAVGESDDDGNAASGHPDTPEPEGYADWALDIKAAADEGLPAFTRAWQASRSDYREHLARRNPHAFNQLKTKAAKAGGATS